MPSKTKRSKRRSDLVPNYKKGKIEKKKTCEQKDLFSEESFDESPCDDFLESKAGSSEDESLSGDFDNKNISANENASDENPSKDFEHPDVDDSFLDAKSRDSSALPAAAGFISSLKERMLANVQLLEKFSELRQQAGPESIPHPRSYYVEKFLADACILYGYSEFMMTKLHEIFARPSELIEFLEANESPRPITIRTNTLKTRRRELAQALVNRGATVEPLSGKWSDVALQVFESTVPIGATPEYLSGQYLVQSASSLLPVMALGARPNERILDMSAAPGGKTTHIAAEMQNSGCLVANDPNPDRCRSLAANIHRMGIHNCIVSACDGRDFPRVIGGFDRVLLDAPCSGTGVISKDPSVKTSKTAQDFSRLTHLQKELILAAIDSCQHNHQYARSNRSKGEDQADDENVEISECTLPPPPKDTSEQNYAEPGIIVYSTCSITVEENEEVIAYALSRRPNVRLVDTGLPFGHPGMSSFRGKNMHRSLTLTRRFYPHAHNLDGFFVAKLVKFAPTNPNLLPKNTLPTKQANKNNNVSKKKHRKN